MFTTIENQYGVITYRKQLLSQLLEGAIAPYEAEVQLKSKLAKETPEGLYVRLELHVKFGESISTICNGIGERLASGVRDSLELPLDNIIISVTATVSGKKVIPRDIVFNYARSSITYN